MNFTKIINYGTLYMKCHQSLPILRSLDCANNHANIIRPAFFSHFTNIFRSTEINKLIKPALSAVEPCRGMKTRGHLQLRCKDCYMARKDGHMYVFCSSYPRHKQKKLTKRTKYTWILTYAFHSKQRPY